MKKKISVNNPLNLSISIIGHNEEKNLKKLLPTLSWAKEVIYVDCESQDDSIKIAKKYKCRCFSCKNNKNFNINKQFGINQCLSEWVFYLDPDERIPKLLKEEISRKIFREMSTENQKYQAFNIPRKNYYFTRFLKYGNTYPDFQLRLFQRKHGYFKQEHVHEKIKIDGKVGTLKSPLLHYSYESIQQYLEKFNFYTSFEADYLLKKGVKVNGWNAIHYIFLKPLSGFINIYFFKRSCLDGMSGLIYSFFMAMQFPIRFFKLWEANQKSNTP